MPPAIFRNIRPVSIKAILLRMVGQVRRQILKVEAGCMSIYDTIPGAVEVSFSLIV
jgi:hypothetical protein